MNINMLQPSPLGNYTLEIGQMDKRGFKIFDFDYPFYDPEHKKEFERKFILHFRYHEIGQETIQRFKYMLQDVLTTEYPKYLHYYKTSEVAKNLQWQYNKDYYEENQRVLDTTDNNTSNSSSNTTGNSSSWNQTDDITDSTSKFSDTPQGELNNLDNYLTNATVDRTEDVITSNTDSSDSSESKSTSTSNRTGRDIETIINKQYGNIGTTSSGDLVESWNKQAIWFNIDKIIFDDCEQLFMGIY